MSCAAIEPVLVAYHFGIVSDEERDRLEEHLGACPSCLHGFFALKRDLETAASEPRPSPAARARLRRAVAVELGLAPAGRAWSWWERPFAFGFAAAAVVAAVVALRVLATGPGTRPYSLAVGPNGQAALTERH
jgi:anti-sigma factor RsiW